ncbi:hypothetical protein [Candidatus Spongiihabitans sp.]|uniref:hypothetical protein n=1 Tax=Candidatus Spongiihabitans sp. TaxID=3101308 RepID=UPI003C7CD6C0
MAATYWSSTNGLMQVTGAGGLMQVTGAGGYQCGLSRQLLRRCSISCILAVDASALATYAAAFLE